MDESSAEHLLSGARFGELPEPLARELAKRGQKRTVRKGALVHEKGAPADGLYRVLSGRLHVQTGSEDGRMLLLTDLTPGAVFGEIALFDGLSRTHDVLAVERSELLFVPRSEVHAMLQLQPELASHFLRMLALKVRLSMAALDSVALRSVAARLALRLLLLARWTPATEGPVQVSASQSDLANMVGATRQSVNRELKAWERDGLIALRGRTLTILAGQALLALTRP